jgi:competence protein ComEC
MINFKTIPFLRILFPFVAGIAASLQFGFFRNFHFVFLISLLCLLAAFLFQRLYKPVAYLKKGLYIASINCFLFLLAFESLYLYKATNYATHYSHYVAREAQHITGVIEDMPVVTGKFIKVPFRITSVKNNSGWHNVNGKTIIYLKHEASATAAELAIGNALLLKAKLGYVNAPQNPGEFDYKTFLEEKNIFHVIYAKPAEFCVMNEKATDFSITQSGARIKAKVVSVLRHSGLSPEAFSICSALLVGYDDEIDSSVMQSFSHSGTLHILSVSGMHTGVLFAILMWIFAKADKYERYEKLKCFCVILSLFLFVLITGFSPSVLRAALMLTLVILGKTFYRNGNSYNTLLLSAFILLLFNPYLIKDVGFLLSYFAVFGIIYFYPTLHKIHVFENSLLQWLWSGALVSVAATLFTLPITLYFFHQFPIWFILSNAIIIPISMVLMVGAAALLCLGKITVINAVLAYVINGSTAIMLWLAQLTDKPGIGYMDFISFSKTDALFCSALILLFLVVIVSKQYKHVMYLGGLCIVWLCFSIVNSYAQSRQKELVLFHVKHQSVFALRCGQTIYTNLNGISDKEFQRYVKPYLLRFPNLKMIETKANLLKGTHTSIGFINRKGLAFPSGDIKHWVVSNDTPLQIPLNTVKNGSTIIADCSNSYKFVRQLKKACEQNHIAFYSVRESGALTINLN